MTVFANGLEISAKKQGCKVIAAFPDTCFTPPQTPATPPGVPVPYPDFGNDGDLTSGTGTVKIGGETVSQENSSKFSKCSGDEAGSAPKKGIITSKNTGAIYAQKWSMDVKFEGKGVVRFSDMATSNHSSNPGDSPPMALLGAMNPAFVGCAKVYADLDGHAHGKKKEKCDNTKTGRESEHTTRAAAMLHTRKGDKRAEVKCPKFPNYDEQKAPCICMNATRVNKKKSERAKKDMPHSRKTIEEENFLEQSRGNGCRRPDGKITASSCNGLCGIPKVGDLTKIASNSTAKEHSRTKRKSEKEKKEVSDCLEVINLAYIAEVDEKDTPEEAKKKIEDVKKKPICGKGVCKSKATACHGCKP